MLSDPYFTTKIREILSKIIAFMFVAVLLAHLLNNTNRQITYCPISDYTKKKIRQQNFHTVQCGHRICVQQMLCENEEKNTAGRCVHRTIFSQNFFYNKLSNLMLRIIGIFWYIFSFSRLCEFIHMSSIRIHRKFCFTNFMLSMLNLLSLFWVK